MLIKITRGWGGVDECIYNGTKESQQSHSSLVNLSIPPPQVLSAPGVFQTYELANIDQQVTDQLKANNSVLLLGASFSTLKAANVSVHTVDKEDRKGWLVKRGGNVKNWKRRFFHLTDSVLYYYENDSGGVEKGKVHKRNRFCCPLSPFAF